MTAKEKRQHLTWLLELTGIPTAAGCESRVEQWVERWCQRRKDLRVRSDRWGNLHITQTRRSSRNPIFITAHLDHPAFVVRSVLDNRTIELEFRGGVMDPYFIGGRIEVFDSRGAVQNAQIKSLQVDAQPFKRVTATLARTEPIAPGNIARWRLPAPIVKKGLLHAPACDDLAGAAAALSALDTIRRMPRLGNVGVLLTRAEEIGFVGAIAAARNKTIPRTARLLCLETSRTFPESPIGGGPILRVGDKSSVFGPELTNRIAEIMHAHARDNPKFSWQRKLMPGGTCESTAFCNYGYLSTCLCLALGNYHNMHHIDGVAAGKRPAKIASEVISIDDYHGLVEMLVVTCQHLGDTASSAMRRSLDNRLRQFEKLLQSSS